MYAQIIFSEIGSLHRLLEWMMHARIREHYGMTRSFGSCDVRTYHAGTRAKDHLAVGRRPAELVTGEGACAAAGDKPRLAMACDTASASMETVATGFIFKPH